MRAELKLFHLAAQCLRRGIRVERNGIARSSRTQNSTRRFRISVTNEQNGMTRIFHDAAREDIGERFGRHHSARQRIHSPCPCRRIVDGLSREYKRGNILKQLQTRKLAPRLIGPPVINFRHF